MLRALFLMTCLNFNVALYSQTLLYQGNNEALYLLDLTTNQTQKLSADAFGKLVGYKIKDDSLVCYIQIRGKLITQDFKSDLFKKITPYPISMKPDFEEKHIATRQFFFSEYELDMNGNSLSLYKNQKIVWSTDKSVNERKTDSSRIDYLYGFCHPQISPTLDKILVEGMDTRMFVGGNNRIYEFDMQTGTQSLIAKGRNASYSLDGRYILYQDNKFDNYSLLDKTTKKKLDNLVGAIEAFWLYR